MIRQDQIQTSSAKHVGRIAQKQFRLETDYGTFKFELSQVFQATKVQIAPARKQDKETYPAMIELRNGSYLKGDLGPSNIRIRVDGPYGEASIPISLLNSVTVQEDRKTIDIALKNGDRLKGSLAGSNQLELKTASGTRLILPNETTRISLSGSTMVPSKGLVLHLSFDEKMEKVRDLSGKGNHGVVIGAKWTPKGKVGGAYDFDGKSDYLELGPTNLYKTTGQLSACAWLFVRGQTAIVLSNYHGGDAYGGQFFFDCSTTNNDGARSMCVLLGQAPGVAVRYLSSKRPIPKNQWCHVAFSYDESRGNGNKVKLYLNGEEMGNYEIQSEGNGGPILDIGENLRIMAHRDTPTGTLSDAMIDEVMLFNRALSADEIRRLYEQ